jgi:tetratricopeptide (TPR) repeat protein
VLLDSEEYLHLAIHATQNQQHHAALEYLHKCLEQEPENARGIFLLAAEYAELGLRKRAIEFMSKAIELDPSLEMAHYQLGLLHTQDGNFEDCREIWANLATSAQDPAIRLVSKGLAIIEAEYETGLNLVKEATQVDTSNSFLKSSIRNIYDNLIGAHVNTSESKTVSEPTAALSTETNRVMFLDAYRKSDFQEND